MAWWLSWLKSHPPTRLGFRFWMEYSKHPGILRLIRAPLGKLWKCIIFINFHRDRELATIVVFEIWTHASSTRSSQETANYNLCYLTPLIQRELVLQTMLGSSLSKLLQLYIRKIFLDRMLTGSFWVKKVKHHLEKGCSIPEPLMT